MRAILATTVVVAAVAAALLSTAAAAEVTLGANIGSARADGGDFDGTDTSWKLYVGSTFDEFIGGEIGYVSFENLGGGNGPKVQAFTPAVTLGARFGLARIYGKAGVAFADVEGSAISDEYKDEEPFFGLGARFKMTPGLGFRTEYERYTVGNQDIDMAQIGLELRF